MIQATRLFLLMIMFTDPTIMFDFFKGSINSWQIINDGVMGGLSTSKIIKTEDGYGKFSGQISLENNGGFASVRHMTDFNLESDQNTIILKVKGDGKKYQFRLKSDLNQAESYVKEFQTNGDWQSIELKIDEFSPQFRGRSLNMPNFQFSKIEEVRFLIANKKEEDFELLIDKIEIK